MIALLCLAAAQEARQEDDWAAAQEDDLTADKLAEVAAALDRIACLREVAVACCLGCGARRKLKTCAKCPGQVRGGALLRPRVRRARLAGAQAKLPALAMSESHAHTRVCTLNLSSEI